LINRLKTLYELQILDDQLDDLEELRGDLPHTVENLEMKINSLKDDTEEKEVRRRESLEKREENEEEIEKLRANQKKFKAQLYQVRNNKEYDALTKEIDNSEDLINKMEAENNA
jgi:predicted  nucleic acid-binding Zn-ribbon protein